VVRDVLRHSACPVMVVEPSLADPLMPTSAATSEPVVVSSG
jgi:hypothetical protein